MFIIFNIFIITQNHIFYTKLDIIAQKVLVLNFINDWHSDWYWRSDRSEEWWRNKRMTDAEIAMVHFEIIKLGISYKYPRQNLKELRNFNWKLFLCPQVKAQPTF